MAANARIVVAVGTRDLAVDDCPSIGVEAAVAPRHGEARDQPFEVPLERAGQRLVEVVEVEHQRPIGRRVRTEVRQVRIAAELGVDARPRQPGEVGRHQVGGAAVEGEGRDEHPPVAQRHQLRDARRRLLLEQLDRTAPIWRRLPGSVGAPWDLARAPPVPPTRALPPSDARWPRAGSSAWFYSTPIARSSHRPNGMTRLRQTWHAALRQDDLRDTGHPPIRGMTGRLPGSMLRAAG